MMKAGISDIRSIFSMDLDWSEGGKLPKMPTIDVETAELERLLGLDARMQLSSMICWL